MVVRIVTAIVALAVFVPILLFAPAGAVAAVFGLLAAVAVYEITGCVGLKKEWWLTVSTMALCFVSVSCGYPQSAERLLFSAEPVCFLALLTLLYVVAAVLRYEALPADRLMLQFGLVCYVCLGFYALGRFAAEKTSVWLWTALCIPWIADSLAYFVGRFLGKRKLCPAVSPKKTVAGAVGGVAGTGIVALLVYGGVYGWNRSLSLALIPVLAMVLAVISIFGDLFASVVKRRFGVKDYGRLFPGHGGVMDRFDSTIAVAITMLLLSISFGGLLL